MNRPSVRYQPARAAEAEISTTSKKASQPLRRFRARRSRSLAARRSAVGACTGLGTAGGGASITVRGMTIGRGWACAAGHRSRHHLGHFVVGAVAPPRRAGPLPGFGPQLTGELGVIGETLLDARCERVVPEPARLWRRAADGSRHGPSPG